MVIFENIKNVDMIICRMKNAKVPLKTIDYFENKST